MKHHKSIGNPTTLYTISVVSFFVALHVALPNYFNSSFLGTLVNNKTVSLVYFIEALITIFALLSMHGILRRFGNYKTAIGLVSIQILIFYGIIFSKSAIVIVPLIILALVVVSLIGFTLDIFLEKSSDTEHVGAIRGNYMTVTNSAWILGPLLGGMLILGNDYKGVYVAAFGLLFPLLYLIRKNFSRFVDSAYPQITLRQTIISLLKNKDISRLWIINISLQVFYAWMTVYTPIYLSKNIGFDWSEIGIIFTIMLIPFVLVDIPLGKLADKKFGEKEIMAIGFIIMGISTACLAFFSVKNVMLWAILLFITRVGAATVEIMIETYFFKKVDQKDSEILGAFRVTRPLSFLIAPILTLIGLVFVQESYLFILLGFLCVATLIPTAMIKDTN
jgi:Na+/melibiose symporter-like transporter